MIRWRLPNTPYKTSGQRLAWLVILPLAGVASANEEARPNLAFLEFLGMTQALEQIGVVLEETPPDPPAKNGKPDTDD